MLSEGQRQGSLEVIEINPKARTVKIKFEELISTITFETNKPAGGPGLGNMAAGVPRPPGAPPGRGFNPPGGFTPAASPGFGGAPGVPARPVRTTDNSQVVPQSGGGYLGGYAQASYQAPQGSSASSSAGTSIPGSLFNQAQSPATPTPAPSALSAPALSAEEQVAMLYANQQMHESEVKAGTFPSVPQLPGLPPPPGSPPAPPMPGDSSDDSSGPPMPTLPPGFKATGTLSSSH